MQNRFFNSTLPTGIDCIVGFYFITSICVRRPRSAHFLGLFLMTGGCFVVLHVVSFFTKTGNTTIHDILAWIDNHAVSYPQEPYIVIPNLITAHLQHDGVDDNEIVICTQTSLNNLYRAINLSRIWDGTISVAVFSFGSEITLAIYYMILMHMCSDDVRRKVSFHLVFPTSHPPTQLTSLHDMDLRCSNLQLLQLQQMADNFALNIPYPPNVLRNVALMYSTPPYVMILDIDFTPSKEMKNEMETFLKNLTQTEKHKKLAYIIPAFESNVTIYDPLSKKDVLAVVENGTVRQFGVNKCRHCHAASNYSRWLSLPYPSITSVSYYVEFLMGYEPFYIANREHIPMYHSIFKQFGYDRASQLCETYYSGYDFAVMNNLFVIHDGFKDIKDYTEQKQAENWNNGLIFQNIVVPYLQSKYPYSDRQC